MSDRDELDVTRAHWDALAAVHGQDGCYDSEALVLLEPRSAAARSPCEVTLEEEVAMARTMLTAAAVAAACALVLGSGLASGGDGDRGRASALSDRAFFAVLNGGNEVGGGDRNGRGSATVTFDGRSLCWGLAVTNLSRPVGAHIHEGRSNQDGSIVVELEQPGSGDPGASSGCETVTAALARAIRRNPNRYYVNVHNAKYPGGALRGQLVAGMEG